MVHGTSINMLDCKMNSSLSPVTPVNIHQESYMGMWEQEPLNQQHPAKMNDIIDMLHEPSLAHSSGGTTSPTTTIHHQNRGDCHFQSSHYLTPLPNLGDPYSSGECHQIHLEGFPPSSDNNFHKLPETPSNFSENYDMFISDLNPPPPHQHHNSGSNSMINNNSVLHHNGQCSPGCICSSSPFSPHNHHHHHHHNNNNHHHHHHHLNLNGDPLGALGHPSSNSSQQEYNWDDLTCDPGEYLFLPKGDSPTTSESINSYNTDIDSEMESKSSRGSVSLQEICHVSPPKRKVGRPPKKDKKMKRNEKKTGRLWEFIRDLLKNPEYCPSLVRWENPEEGHFRFVNSEKVAQLWGQIKGNPRMTYEKLSRAMRYYYKSHVFEPVLGRRLVYKFGYNATNWRPVNANFVSIQKLYSN
ncbi:nuclear transcription factor Y subunit gamma isoform X2 [Folsomia candida]|uniref:ETS ous factor n=1 Tax=Folsomia candida TaxID=158441 RepID=A0A226ETV2_FOLCA|nr:nuclear transcription factor Y subunit gamma isoform X2 [Folsomia candida]OXA60638.1 ETS ous factor [Folsomia candida]